MTVIYAFPCGASPVIVGGSYYSQCGSTWYSRANQGGSAVYVVSGPPY